MYVLIPCKHTSISLLLDQCDEFMLLFLNWMNKRILFRHCWRGERFILNCCHGHLHPQRMFCGSISRGFSHSVPSCCFEYSRAWLSHFEWPKWGSEDLIWGLRALSCTLLQPHFQRAAGVETHHSWELWKAVWNWWEDMSLGWAQYT